jgi:hypothetical protein
MQHCWKLSHPITVLVFTSNVLQIGLLIVMLALTYLIQAIVDIQLIQHLSYNLSIHYFQYINKKYKKSARNWSEMGGELMSDSYSYHIRILQQVNCTRIRRAEIRKNASGYDLKCSISTSISILCWTTDVCVLRMSSDSSFHYSNASTIFRLDMNLC